MEKEGNPLSILAVLNFRELRPGNELPEGNFSGGVMSIDCVYAYRFRLIVSNQANYFIRERPLRREREKWNFLSRLRSSQLT